MRQNYNPNMPPVVMNLLIINVLVFIATLLPNIGDKLFSELALYFPTSPHFRIWQPLTHMFVHANQTMTGDIYFWHLFTNMFALWMFGRIVEYDLGSKRFLIYYLVCGLGAALLQMGVNWIEIGSYANEGNFMAAAMAVNTPMVGASGAVFGILLAFGMMRPNSVIMLLLPPIPMKAKWFVIIYGLIELFFGVRGGGDGIAHFAHIGGMLWGFLLLLYWKKKGKIHY